MMRYDTLDVEFFNDEAGEMDVEKLIKEITEILREHYKDYAEIRIRIYG